MSFWGERVSSELTYQPTAKCARFAHKKMRVSAAGDRTRVAMVITVLRPLHHRGHYETVNAALLASHVGEPGSIPGGITPGFSHVGIVPDDAAVRLVYSGISSFPRPCIPALFLTHLNHPRQPSSPRDWPLKERLPNVSQTSSSEDVEKERRNSHRSRSRKVEWEIARSIITIVLCTGMVVFTIGPHKHVRKYLRVSCMPLHKSKTDVCSYVEHRVQFMSELPDKKAVNYDPAKSETYKALQEEELGDTVHEVTVPVQPKVYTPNKPVPSKPAPIKTTWLVTKMEIQSSQPRDDNDSNTFCLDAELAGWPSLPVYVTKPRTTQQRQQKQTKTETRKKCHKRLEDTTMMETRKNTEGFLRRAYRDISGAGICSRLQAD
ncbi:hypothetical protein PR048_012556 [Dryococelus australis]|uniref:Uncharacterized protein n=1 Tax=Dryococelus australis TaxID=614101 RepID=A0ABQ9HQB9_9NEOP|nr:hypothetical protein PR048_012556 [Dryococelus australis]